MKRGDIAPLIQEKKIFFFYPSRKQSALVSNHLFSIEHQFFESLKQKALINKKVKLGNNVS